MTNKKYGKPDMTNLPPKLGRAIFDQILSTPKPDEEKINEEAKKVEAEMIKIRERENN